MLRIEYSIPQRGTNDDTGIVLLVPGFGGSIDSRVYKKMRETFADTYNLVTVQCDYFGHKFMQNANEITFPHDMLKRKLSKEDFEALMADQSKLYDIIGAYSTQFTCKAVIHETENEFADMSYMQAIDNITAVEAVKIILKENDLPFNHNKIFGYGHSQGAYILHLANRMAPHLFSYIIDNSSWVYPLYLHSNRYLYQTIGKAKVAMEFEYMARSYLKDKTALTLHNLYKGFNNGAYIYSLLGTTDNLVNVQDKKASISRLNYTHFELIDQNKVDGEIFKSTNHGLDADFLKLFDAVIKKIPEHQNRNEFMQKYIISSAQTRMIADYGSVLPLFQFM